MSPKHESGICFALRQTIDNKIQLKGTFNFFFLDLADLAKESSVFIRRNLFHDVADALANNS